MIIAKVIALKHANFMSLNNIDYCDKMLIFHIIETLAYPIMIYCDIEIWPSSYNAHYKQITS